MSFLNTLRLNRLNRLERKRSEANARAREAEARLESESATVKVGESAISHPVRKKSISQSGKHGVKAMNLSAKIDKLKAKLGK